MIEYTTGNIFDSDAEALVNPVNTVGVMGKGLALEFKKRYPTNFEVYKNACELEALRIGTVLTTALPSSDDWIINFPTKKHWRNPSTLAILRASLGAMREEVAGLYIKSVAIPPIGCGLGGLRWEDVKRVLEEELAKAPKVRWIIYEPKGETNG